MHLRMDLTAIAIVAAAIAASSLILISSDVLAWMEKNGQNRRRIARSYFGSIMGARSRVSPRRTLTNLCRFENAGHFDVHQ